jgi:hypothetical protein
LFEITYKVLTNFGFLNEASNVSKQIKKKSLSSYKHENFTKNKSKPNSEIKNQRDQKPKTGWSKWSAKENESEIWMNPDLKLHEKTDRKTDKNIQPIVIKENKREK